MIAVLQFDAASAALLERLEGEGRLPNLTELRQRGSKVDLETPAEHFPASAYQNLSAADARAALGLATTDNPQFATIELSAA